MPKLKPTRQKLLGERVVNNIRAIGGKAGCRYDKDIAKRVIIPQSTFCEKMKNPDRFRLDDFIHIAEGFGISLAKIFED